MDRTHELLTPAGVLVVVDSWQDIYVDGGGIADPVKVLVGRWRIGRAAYLDGQLLPWSEASRDLLAAVADAIDGGPPCHLVYADREESEEDEAARLQVLQLVVAVNDLNNFNNPQVSGSHVSKRSRGWPVQIPLTATVWMYIPVDAPPDIPDPSIYPAQAALVDDNGTEPAPGDYHPAVWIRGEIAMLVGSGPGGVPYPSGDYMAFGKVTAGVEIVPMKSGRVRIGSAGN